MIRVQIQLPEPLAEELKGIAGVRDISFAELCRRGLERYAKQWAKSVEPNGRSWEFPILPANEMREEAVLDRQEVLAVATRNV